MSNQLAVIEQNFIGLDTLPSLYKQNTELTEKAKLAVRPKMDEFNKANLATAELPDLNKWDADLNELAVKVKTCLEKNEGRRKPQTQKMDAIKKLFTADEAALNTLLDELVAGRNKIALVLLNKSREDEKKKQAVIDAQNDTIDLKSRINARLAVAYTNYVSERTKSMRDKFYEQTAETMEDYIKKLIAHVPDLKSGAFTIENPAPTAYNDKQAIIGLVVDAIRAAWPGFKDRYVDTINEARDSLVEIKDNRIAELLEIASGSEKAAQDAANRKKQEDDAAKEKQEQEAADALTAGAISAEAEKLNAALTVEATADVSAKQASGTRVSQEYEIVAKSGWVAIMQWYMTNEFAKMTDAEAAKKFSFMLAPANKALNAGTTISNPGLKIIDAVSTRTSKSKP